jgi:hypothetical protein
MTGIDAVRLKTLKPAYVSRVVRERPIGTSWSRTDRAGIW